MLEVGCSCRLCHATPRFLLAAPELEPKSYRWAESTLIGGPLHVIMILSLYSWMNGGPREQKRFYWWPSDKVPFQYPLLGAFSKHDGGPSTFTNRFNLESLSISQNLT